MAEPKTNRKNNISPEGRETLSRALKERNKDPEFRKRVAAGHVGKKRSPASISKRIGTIAASRVERRDEAKRRVAEDFPGIIPNWVPEDLIPRFAEVFESTGCEIIAARHVRRMKAKAAEKGR